MASYQKEEHFKNDDSAVTVFTYALL